MSVSARRGNTSFADGQENRPWRRQQHERISPDNGLEDERGLQGGNVKLPELQSSRGRKGLGPQSEVRCAEVWSSRDLMLAESQELRMHSELPFVFRIFSEYLGVWLFSGKLAWACRSFQQFPASCEFSGWVWMGIDWL